MRLTSDFWVSALIRTVEGKGGFAYLARRGAREAGAIFIRCNSRLGTADLYMPAPQSIYDDNADGQRQFARILHDAEAEQVDDKMQREMRYDPDLWLVELEDVQDVKDLFPVADDGS